jgi:GNAT superfamily N-acetyltransferase
MIVRQMTLDDLSTVLGWAREEGWNPGLDDAPAFLAADPQGFFLAELAGQPAAAISVVNHDAAQAFLGLYICRPAFRGQGVGFTLWQHALEHAGMRAVGLDGVPDQQENYARSGFRRMGRTIRFRGQVAGARTGVRAAGPEDLPGLIAADRAAVGHARDRFAQRWFKGTATRRTLLGAAGGFATFRQCHEGIKIGPFQAPDKAAALDLLAGRPEGWQGPLFVDVPEGSALQGLVEDLGFEPVFQTARMVRGIPPAASPPEFHAVATLELG